MEEKFVRTGLLLGEENLEKLKNAHVAVFGVGGVGGYTVEALVRSGIGEITIVDKDVVAEPDLNRQIIATVKTVGRKKVGVFKERILEIRPECIVHARECFYLPETSAQFDFSEYDYVVDAVDTVTAKIALVLQAQAAEVPVISCMGAGNKLDPSLFEVAYLKDTSVCPLARVMRRELKRRNADHLKVVYSREKPVTRQQENAVMPAESGKSAPGSVAFVPPVAGLLLAGEVIRDLIKV